MNEAELQAMEHAAQKAAEFHVDPKPHEKHETATRCYCRDVPALIAEIRRLWDRVHEATKGHGPCGNV